MPGISYTSNKRTTPLWMHDDYTRERIRPNGIKINIFRVPAVNGIRSLPGGTLMGRIPGAFKYEPCNPGFTSNNATITVAPTTATDTVIKVQSVDGYAPNHTIMIGATAPASPGVAQTGGVAATVASINRFENTITLAAAIGAGAGVSAVGGLHVSITGTVAAPGVLPIQGNRHLLATDHENLEFNGITAADEGALLRHRFGIYVNYLPRWVTPIPGTDTAVTVLDQTIKDYILANYDCFTQRA